MSERWQIIKQIGGGYEILGSFPGEVYGDSDDDEDSEAVCYEDDEEDYDMDFE